jgi:hypothetical protein
MTMAGRKEVILRGEAPAWAAEARAAEVEGEDRMAVVADIDQQSPILLGQVKISKIKSWRNVICAERA